MITAKMEGADQIAGKMLGIARRLSPRVKLDALLKAAEPIRSRASQLAPRGPIAPHLADNIVVSIEQEGQEPTVGVGPSKQVPYGGFQELGTRFHPAQPYLRPAFEQNVTTATETVGEVLWTEVKESL